jgi:hypothetical protein
LLESGAYEEALAIQTREQPLLSRMAELLVQPGVAGSLPAAVQSRAQSLLNAQAEQSKRLAARRTGMQQELQALRSAQTRLQQLRPAYGHNDAQGSFAGQA